MPTPLPSAARGHRRLRFQPLRLEPLRVVARVPLFLPLFVASVLVGFRNSMSLPYTTLFAIERAHMGPLAVGVYLTVRAAGAIAISMLFGLWFDRRPSLWPLILSLFAGALGYALMTTTSDFLALCLIGAVPLGMGAAAFPLIFAVAKGWAARSEYLCHDPQHHLPARQLLAGLGRRSRARRARGRRGPLQRAVLGQRHVQRARLHAVPAPTRRRSRRRLRGDRRRVGLSPSCCSRPPA